MDSNGRPSTLVSNRRSAVAWAVNNVFEYQDVPSIPVRFTMVVASGLGRLSAIGGDLTIDGNNTLSSVAALSNVTSIGGDLTIDGNNTLASISTMTSLSDVSGNFTVTGNNSLNQCDAYDLHAQVTVAGDVTIAGNQFDATCPDITP